MSYPTITVSDLKAKLDGGASLSLVDVRMPTEYRELHAEPAKNRPLDRLRPSELINEFSATCEAPLYVICQKGGRSKMACDQISTAGYGDRIVNVEGGTLAWEAAGLPLVRGKKAISLERQVRIVAGALALTGGLLALTVDPRWAALSAFIGAGLVFAGVTDTCGMGMVLARMPWNQVGCDASSCSTR